ncbi:NB-ARC domain-containing protein [Salinifilum ghardaiensis]
MDQTFEQLAGTVAGDMASAGTSVALSAAGSLAQSVWQKLRSRGVSDEDVLADPDELARLLEEYSRDDPEGARELVEAHIAANPARGMTLSRDRSVPFFDRDGVRGAVAETPLHGVLVFSGQHGIGKTSLVRQLAEDLHGRFGDDAYVDFDEHRDGDALAVSAVQREVLSQLGVQVLETAPAALDQQYRRVTARRCLLLVCDNVLGTAELDAVLPADSGHTLTLAATRFLAEEFRLRYPAERCRELLGLEEEGAWELLASKCGREKLEAEPAATARLLEVTDYVPYAVERVGTVLQRRRYERQPVAELLEELSGSGVRRGAELVRFCLDATFAELPEDFVRQCRLLAEHPGSDFTVDSAALWLGAPARPVLDLAQDAGVLAPGAPGRYRLPYLTRVYLRQRADLEVDRESAVARVLRYYVDTAVAADHALEDDQRQRAYRKPECAPWTASQAEAVAWLADERHVLAELAELAHERGLHEDVCRISGAFELVLLRRGHHRTCERVTRCGIASAEALGEPAWQARGHAMLGRISTQLHDFPRAETELNEAAGLLAGLGRGDVEASVLEFRARLYEEWAEAAGHYDYTPAREAFSAAVELDRRCGPPRALALHLRMLANVEVKSARPAGALRLLEQAEAAHRLEPRNLSRVHTVRAKAHVVQQDPERAQAAVHESRALVPDGAAT